MCEAVDFFRQALAEQGLDAEILHESNEHTDTFLVRKNIAGENIVHTINVSHREQRGEPSTKKRMAIKARTIADRFHEQLTESFEWNGRAVDIEPYDGPEASCRNCGATVELPSRSAIFAQSAELSAPQPMPVKDETVLESLDEHSRVLLKMYLMGKLREECDSYCVNSKHNNERMGLLS